MYRARIFTAVLVTLLATTLSAQQAGAFTPRAQNGCSEIRFASSPDVVMHTTEMVGWNFIEVLQLTDAMIDIHTQFNRIGGTWISIGNFTTSTDPFTFTSWFGGNQPIIHVGFTSDPTAAPGAAFWDVDPNTCEIREAHIQIQDGNTFSYTGTEPELQGEDYYLTGLTAASGERYYRITYQHELLHAFGLAHSNDGYAMLNYGERQWLNRASGDRIQALPDDVEGIRYLYPADTDRTEIGVLNSWYVINNGGGTYPAADQDFLCSPSTGDDWADNHDALCGETNGVPGSTAVCPGDVLRTRVAVANYGTSPLDVRMTLWFSEDDVWDGFNSVDVRSPDAREFTLGGSSSSKQGRNYEVPTGLSYGQEYYVILRARGTEQGTGIVTRDWIPLRGKIQIKPFLGCLTVVPTPLNP